MTARTNELNPRRVEVIAGLSPRALESKRERQRAYRNTPEGREAFRRYARKFRQEMKLRCLLAYGGDPPRCACCGESIIAFLTLDHVHNNGTEHKRALGTPNGGGAFYQRLITLGFPAEPPMQVLCFNCNCGRHQNHGVCPHVLSKRDTARRLTPDSRPISGMEGQP